MDVHCYLTAPLNPLFPFLFHEHLVIDGLEHWSEWGTCSSQCGNGLMTRKRTCKKPLDSTDIGAICEADVVESRPCLGNKKCIGKFMKMNCIYCQHAT